MDELLVVRTTKKRADGPSPRPLIAEVSQPDAVNSSSEVLNLLRGEPDLQTVHQCLECLTRGSADGDSFDIRFPSPLAAQITHALTSNIIPNYWAPLQKDTSSKSTKQLLKKVLRTVSGLGAILAQLKSFIAERSDGEKLGSTEKGVDQGRALVQVLEEIFDDELINDICRDIFLDAPKPQQKLLLRDFVQLIASGRIISTIAETEPMVCKSDQQSRRSWLSSGSDYSRWLSRSIAQMVKELELGCEQEAMWATTSQMLGNALSLGYTGMSMGTRIASIPH
jgi:telomere length regulation protein